MGAGGGGRLESRCEPSGQVVKLDRGLLGDDLRPGFSTDTWLRRPRQHGGGIHSQAGRFGEIPRISYPRYRRERAWSGGAVVQGNGKREISCGGAWWSTQTVSWAGDEADVGCGRWPE